MPFSDDFKYVRTLGKGNFGSVELCRYVGDNPDIIALCDENIQVAVKFQKTYDAKEHLVANHITQITRGQSVPFNRTYSYVSDDGDDDTVILSQYVTYDTVHEKGKARGVSRNAETFFQHIGGGVTTGPTAESRPFHQAFREDFPLMLSQFASSMHSSQRGLHQFRVLHRDTALRNFLIQASRDEQGNVINLSAQIIDYGLCEILEPGQDRVHLTNTQGPIRSVAHEIFDNAASAQTDHFALRATMICMVGVVSSYTDFHEHHYLQLLTPNPSEDGSPLDLSSMRFLNNVEYVNQRINNPKYFNDVNVLKDYLQFARMQVDQVINPDKREGAELFLDCYENYLLQLPQSSSHEEAQIEDRALLLSANRLFYSRYFELLNNKLSLLSDADIAQKERILLSLKRLQTLEIDDEHLKNALDAVIQQLELNHISTPRLESEESQLARELEQSQHEESTDGPGIYLGAKPTQVVASSYPEFNSLQPRSAQEAYFASLSGGNPETESDSSNVDSLEAYSNFRTPEEQDSESPQEIQMPGLSAPENAKFINALNTALKTTKIGTIESSDTNFNLIIECRGRDAFALAKQLSEAPFEIKSLETGKPKKPVPYNSNDLGVPQYKIELSPEECLKIVNVLNDKDNELSISFGKR